MASHNELGKAGEDAAVAYLEKNEYVIRHRNWRKGHLELDIVAAKDNELIVVEVKTRSDATIMQPEDAVTVQKIRRRWNLSRLKSAVIMQLPSICMRNLVSKSMEPSRDF